ncbi:dihydrolipoamide acetyltransferase family protein [Rhodococcus sp. IEGM 1409]|uniref:dihydrolipoamide acetyltransferase family protein n=1 Tax=Rhodococcus sp. IEGM 1409 TaxID=3047082 RepID=UPI0024B6DAEB|nr:dihydrolipoamide acetyltransferase family protein [Rhodococcus sp. IEGM 1409]MDI9901927.1 dihydrolipoamide acetyltransferase family protein [Rhodococcus sp. IEGM 1409]
MTDQVFMLPDLGEGLAEADIAEWHVKVGDVVTIDQIVVEVETAKAAVDVPIPFAGTVIELHGKDGDTLKVGTPLITVSGSGGRADDGVDNGVSADHERYREEERAGSGNVLIGYGTSEDAPLRRRRAAPSVRVISPIVRKLASDNSIDLATISGSGAGGVITRADVEVGANIGSETPHATDQRIPIKGLRKVVADKLSTSRREIPDATTWVDVDATELFTARAEINKSLPDSDKISLMALLARLTTAALAQYPELNSSVDTARGEIIRHARIHLGIAAQTPKGLMVPVIRNADSLSTVELAQALRTSTELARDGKLEPARLTGGTFTLNNYGVFGVDGSTPIINHPEAAILGIGRMIDKPWVVNGELSIRKVTQISLSFDHRVCDGGEAGGFLRLFGDYIENPIRVLGRL